VTRVEHRWQDWLQGHTRAFPRETRAAIDRGVQVGLAAAEEALEKRVLPRAVGWLGRAPWLALIPVLTFFLFRDAALFREAALDALGSRRLKRRGEALLEDVSRALAAYIRAQLIACAMVGTVCTAYYLAIGLPYGVVLGVGAGILEFVPFVGPLTAGLAALAAGALTSRGEAAAVLAFLFVLRIVQDDIVYPRLVGREVHLHPLAVILAILCGGEVAGVAGIFAAVPLVTVLKVALRHWKEHRAAQAARAADAASGARSA
jgi:predicted PurR-regulated permease PerM